MLSKSLFLRRPDSASFAIVITMNQNGISDLATFGQRLRHFRRLKALTLEQLGSLVGKPAPYLSLLENGKREPKLTVINSLAAVLSVAPALLLDASPPNRRAALELELDRIQTHPLYAEFGLPALRSSARVTDDWIEHLSTLFAAYRKARDPALATAEDVRRANGALTRQLEDAHGYLAAVEAKAGEALDRAGYRGSGAVSSRHLTDLAASFDFEIRTVDDVPASVRSVTDLANRRIYVPQRNELRTRAARKVVLQTLAHVALGHSSPEDLDTFLRHRLETAYFASSVLVPEAPAAAFLKDAKASRDLSVEDLKEVFYVSYEMAAQRLVNLSHPHLSISAHFLRSDAAGYVWKAFAGTGVPLPRDEYGGVEGQRLCRQWGTRAAFQSADKFGIHYQYTDTPGGTFWCATHIEADSEPHHAVTVGVRFEEAKFFRGRETKRHTKSACPNGACCRRPPPELEARWEGSVWASARSQSRLLGILAPDPYPAVDTTEVYEFLDRHTD